MFFVPAASDEIICEMAVVRVLCMSTKNALSRNTTNLLSALLWNLNKLPVCLNVGLILCALLPMSEAAHLSLTEYITAHRFRRGHLLWHIYQLVRWQCQTWQAHQPYSYPGHHLFPFKTCLLIYIFFRKKQKQRKAEEIDEWID